jgi:hypothetical protein
MLGRESEFETPGRLIGEPRSCLPIRLRSCVAWRVRLLGADKYMRLIAATALYFLIVFGVGFVFGGTRFLARATARRDRSHSLRGTVSSLCNVAGRSMAPKSVVLETTSSGRKKS